MTKTDLSLPAFDRPVPVDKRVQGGLFPMVTCRACGWRFHTAEARKDHQWTVHGMGRKAPAVHVESRADRVALEDHGVQRSLQHVGQMLHAKLAVA